MIDYDRWRLDCPPEPKAPPKDDDGFMNIDDSDDFDLNECNQDCDYWIKVMRRK